MSHDVSDELWVRTYALARDREYVERLQRASVEGGDFGLKRDHGLVGTAKWWAAVEAGAIPTRRVAGVLARVYLTAGNWPEFEMVSADGETSTWALEGDAKLYREGRRVRLDFVDLAFTAPRPGADESARIVLGIWVAKA